MTRTKIPPSNVLSGMILSFKPSGSEEVNERANKRLNSGQKGVKVKGIGIAKNLPQGFFDDKTKDANIRGVETPADKEAR